MSLLNIILKKNRKRPIIILKAHINPAADDGNKKAAVRIMKSGLKV